MRRVVITGLGLVCPAGNNVQTAWETILSGNSQVETIQQFDASEFTTTIAAEVKNFDSSHLLSPKEARQISRFVQFAIVAADEATKDANLSGAPDDRHGCAIGVGMGAFWDIEDQAVILNTKGPGRVSPLLVPYCIGNMASGLVSIRHGLRGPSLCTTTACASGNHALGDSLLYIRNGMADVMVAGGAEAPVTPLAVAAFAKMRALSRRNDAPNEASRPFDAQRDGFVIGEGCGMVVLEELEHAKSRGARIYAELSGYGASTDAHHITTPSPNGEGAARSMQAALEQAQMDASDVDYINAHGTSTAANDARESEAISTILGESAPTTPVSSIKGVIGHCLGGAGAIEAVVCAKVLQHQVIPPTANYSDPDPECPLDYVPDGAREQAVKAVLSNSFGFGGHNATLAFRRFD